jgi:DNA-binding XRE family transcriptional regulator
MSTSVLVANSTGLSTSPFANNAAGCVGLAAANTSAGAPCSISVSKAPEPPNVYFAFGSIVGNTFVSDAAARTVGADAPPLKAEAAADFDVAVGDVELEPPRPQPTASAANAIAMSPSGTRRAEVVAINRAASLVHTPESWHPNRIMAIAKGSALRERRLQCGLSQTELAARAEVSRQLVAAVEAGHNTPAVDAALGLARALATTVEDLFAGVQPAVVAALGGPLREHVPLRVGRVGDQFVAAELADHGIAGPSWAKPDGVLEAGQLRLFAGADPAGIVLAGCDPALGVAEAMLGGLGRRSLLALSAPTGIALRALEHGRVHAAVVHGIPQELPMPAVPVLRWHFARWQVGLAVSGHARGNSLKAVLQGDLPIAQRHAAAVSQQAFARASAKAGITQPRPGPHATGHIDAARIAATLKGGAVTTEAAARAFDLRFLPIEDHSVEIWLAQRWLDHPGTNALGELLASSAFTERVAHLAGYDLSGCGTSISRADRR